MGPPLGLDNCHPRNVLWSWPISVIKGYRSINSSIEIARTARDLFIDRLRCYHFLMLICSFCKLLSLARPTSPVLCKDVLCHGLSFPFHLVWKNARLQSVLNRTLHECSDLYVQAFGHACPDFRIAWHNKLPFAQHVLRRSRSDSFSHSKVRA